MYIDRITLEYLTKRKAKEIMARGSEEDYPRERIETDGQLNFIVLHHIMT